MRWGIGREADETHEEGYVLERLYGTVRWVLGSTMLVPHLVFLDL